MIPNHFVRLEELPLNVNGKVDRKSLPDPEGLGLASGVEYVAPRNEIETRLVRIWEEVLQRENVGVNDNFFALGGHSLTAIQLIIRIEKNFGVKISLRNLLSKPTIDSFSEEISTLKWVKDKSKELVVEGDELII
jgi:acyl carrier protein